MQKTDSRGLSSLTLVDDYYECPCHKVYKSYPALYTHIKNKHEGKVFRKLFRPPEPSGNQTCPSRKRGDLSSTGLILH